MTHMFIKEMENSTVCFFCDNEAIVTIINKMSSKNNLIMRLLRPMVLLLMKHNVVFYSKHVEGKLNVVADKLSRYQVSKEFLRNQGMATYPTPLPNWIRPQNLRSMPLSL